MVLFSSDLIDCFFFFKQKTAYEMRISDWSSDVCSSDLEEGQPVDIAIVVFAAFLASGLTLYSGFGLGTVLLPVFAIFFPAEAALAAVAVVHLLTDRKSVVSGKSVSVRVDLGGRRIITKKTKNKYNRYTQTRIIKH